MQRVERPLLRFRVEAHGDEFSRAHAALYRAISLKSQGVETAIVRTSKDEAVRALAKAQRTMAGLSAAGLPIDAD